MARRLRVLFIVSQPTRSSAISVHADLMRFFDRDRVEVHVLYNRHADDERYRAAGTSALDALPATPDIRLVPAEFGPVGDAPRVQLLGAAARAVVPAMRDAGSLVAYIRRHRIDVIHCEQGPRNGFYAYLLSRMTGARCITHFHWNYGPWMSSVSRLAVHRSDAIIPVSAWTGRVLRDAGVPPGRIFPVLNGIDLTRWDPATANGGTIRHEFGIDDGDPLIVMVAQLVAWKRQALVVEAMRAVVDAHPRARLLLVGTESNLGYSGGAISYTDELRRAIGRTGLQDHVILTGQRRDIPQILAAADLSAYPSVGDPCPLAHIEAMAMATPVLGVPAGGTPELVEDGRSGLLGPVDDAAALAANMIALLDDPPRRRRMGTEARQRAVTKLTAKRMADEVEAVYRLVVSGATVAPGSALAH